MCKKMTDKTFHYLKTNKRMNKKTLNNAFVLGDSHQYKIELAYELLSNCVKYITMLGKCDWNSNTLWIKLKIRQRYSHNLLQYA